MTRSLSLPSIVQRDFVQPISKGGTGVMKISEAAAALALVTNAQKDQANGPVSLDASSKLPSAKFVSSGVTNKVNLDGNLSVNVNGVVNFQITDYDSFRSYVVTVDAGTVSRSADIITFTAPSTPQSVQLSVNGRQIPVAVTLPTPAAPSITAPVNGSTSVALNTQIASSAFTVIGGTDTHVCSDWQLSTDSGFTNIVSSVTADTTNKTTWTPPSMPLNTLLYARVRYKGNNGIYGAWSSTVMFTTTSVAAISVEETKLTSGSPRTDSLFGFSVAVSSDGSRVAVGVRDDLVSSVNKGSVYIFSRSGTTWSQEARIAPTNVATYASVGRSVSFSADASVLAIGANNDNGNTSNSGSVLITRRTGTTWSTVTKVSASDSASGDNFGFHVSMSDDGTRFVTISVSTAAVHVFFYNGTSWNREFVTTVTSYNNVAMSGDGLRIAVGAPLGTVSGKTQAGAAHIYSRSGTTWALEFSLIGTDSVQGDNFGAAVALNTTGDRIAVAASTATVSGKTFAGAIYISTRSGVAWTQEAKVVASDSVSQDRLGSNGITISGDGTRVLCGAIAANNNSGKVYSYFRSGSSWSQEKIISASDVTPSAYFGCSVGISKDGTRAIIGAFSANAGATTAGGAAYVYR